MQIGIFFQISSSEKQHAFLPFITPKNCMFSTKNKHANWIFFPDFQLRKTTCISTIYHTKTACYQQRVSMHTGIVFLDFQLIKTACISIIYHRKNCMISTKNKRAKWSLFFQISSSEKQNAFLPFITPTTA